MKSIKDAIKLLEIAKTQLGSCRKSCFSGERWDEHTNTIESLKALLAKQGATKIQFPTALRKMWSGSDIQKWIDENINILQESDRGFKTKIDIMNEAGKTVYALALYHPDRPADANPWDAGRIDLFSTDIKERAEFMKEDWDTFLSHDGLGG